LKHFITTSFMYIEYAQSSDKMFRSSIIRMYILYVVYCIITFSISKQFSYYVPVDKFCWTFRSCALYDNVIKKC